MSEFEDAQDAIANDLVLSLIEEYKQQMALDAIYVERAEKNPKSLTRKAKRNHPEWRHLMTIPGFQDATTTPWILDFGCGTGQADIELAKRDYRVLGIDPSFLAITIANTFKKFEHPPIQDSDAFLVFLCCGAERNPNNFNRFSRLWSSHVFEHIHDIRGTLEQLRKAWAAEGAIMAITVPLGKNHGSPNHVHHWYREQEVWSTFDSPYLRVKTVDKSENGKCWRIVGEFI